MGYTEVITDPDNVTGASSGLGSLSAYPSILSNAVADNAQITIDLHICDDSPEAPQQSIDALRSFDYWLYQHNQDADYQINVFELDSGQHDMERALASAKAISLLQQYGDRVTVVSSANAPQPDGENDNGWEQGDAGNVDQVTPQNTTTAYTLTGDALNLTFAANSVTVVTLS